MTNALRVERAGGVARVWLDRPDVRNALNGALIRELGAAFTALTAEAEAGSVRAIVLGGSGKAFCAGADLAFMREIGTYTWAQNRADAETLAAMLWSMFSCPVPVIARTTYGLIVAGNRPRRDSLRQKVTPSTATRISHTAARPRPPA